MKHIKTFEGKILKYDVGDYVYVEGYPSGILDNFAKIYRTNKFIKAYGRWDYQVDFFDYYNNYHEGIYGTHIDEDDIDRKMTEDEISEFESKITATKYNL
jgi:hypothetical protein